MWIKAQVSTQKAARPSVNALLDFLQDRLLSPRATVDELERV
jgi:hypothetical protein